MGRAKKGLRIEIQQRGGFKHPELEPFIRAMVAQTVSTRMANTMRIVVKMRATTIKGGWDGTAHAPRRQADVKAKLFTINVQRDLPLSRIFVVIAHEIKHCEQLATGRLRHGSLGGRQGRFWRPGAGKAAFFPYSDDAATYWAWPWEVEARGWEKHAVVLGGYAIGSARRSA